MDHRGGSGEGAVDQPAFEALDLLAQCREQDRQAAAGAHGLGEIESTLTSGDGEYPLATPQIVHEEPDHLHAVVQPAEVPAIEKLQTRAHRACPAPQQTRPLRPQPERQGVRQNSEGVGPQRVPEKVVDRQPDRGVVGGDQAADAAPHHGVHRDAQFLKPRQDTDVRGAAEAARAEHESNTLRAGRLPIILRHAACQLLTRAPPRIHGRPSPGQYFSTAASPPRREPRSVLSLP